VKETTEKTLLPTSWKKESFGTRSESFKSHDELLDDDSFFRPCIGLASQNVSDEEAQDADKNPDAHEREVEVHCAIAQHLYDGKHQSTNRHSKEE
jgi:hypothetical protein